MKVLLGMMVSMPLTSVMVEARSDDAAERLARRLAESISA